MENPYRAPQVPFAVDESVLAAVPRHYGGIRRLPYLGISFALVVIQNVVGMILGFVVADLGSDVAAVAILILWPVSVAVSLIPVYYRLKNIGMNPRWCFLMLVPIANLIVGIRCLICQEGYADTKKLDTAGKVVSFIIVGLFALVVVVMVLSIMAN